MASSLQPQSEQKTTPLTAYEQCVSEGKLKNDEAQLLVIAKLQKLYEELSAPRKRSFFEKILPARAPAAAKSIYIWGAVGRGKSLLMDIFHAEAPGNKRRTHFHAFMQEVHALLHAERREIEEKQLKKELIPSVAADLAAGAQLICLDELQVTDVADAMILSKLFTALMEKGVTFVITSNCPPEELYVGGLQREAFMEFVDLVYARMHVLELASPHDYRMQQIRALQNVYMTPLNRQSETAMRDIFQHLTHHTSVSPTTLEVQGRKLKIAESYGGIARLSFADLCQAPLGSADYLAIAHRFHTVFITGIPKLGQDQFNAARRFITLIDVLYDHRVKLVCTAEVAPAELYSGGKGGFEFRRTVSRLAEMQSAQYLATPHIV